MTYSSDKLHILFFIREIYYEDFGSESKWSKGHCRSGIHKKREMIIMKIDLDENIREIMSLDNTWALALLFS